MFPLDTRDSMPLRSSRHCLARNICPKMSVKCMSQHKEEKKTLAYVVRSCRQDNEEDEVIYRGFVVVFFVFLAFVDSI